MTKDEIFASSVKFGFCYLALDARITDWYHLACPSCVLEQTLIKEKSHVPRVCAMKRILVIGRRHSGKLRFVRALTGSLPDVISDESHGGLIHDYRFKNRYFSANVPLWIDEITAGDQALEEFVALYSSEEGEEVMEHVGAIVLCLACDSMVCQCISLLSLTFLSAKWRRC